MRNSEFGIDDRYVRIAHFGRDDGVSDLATLAYLVEMMGRVERLYYT